MRDKGQVVVVVVTIIVVLAILVIFGAIHIGIN